MLEIQLARLIKAYPLQFDKVSGAAVVARAYGYDKFDPATGLLSEVTPGAQTIKSYAEILTLDPTHQMMEFVRMALNISLPSKVDYRQGVPERDIICAMFNFPSFGALINYAKSEPIDPNTTNRAMLEKFQSRYGFYAPIQYLLGRYIHEHTLIIQPDDDKAQRIVDQELTLNPLNNTKVAVVRTSLTGAVWLKVYLPKLITFRGELDGGYPASAASLLGDGNLLVSLISHRPYLLSELVQAHVELLINDSPDGRALILDRVPLKQDTQDFDRAFQLASDNGIHLVVLSHQPNAEIWKRTGIHLIFGFSPDIRESYVEMDKMIGYGAPYIGFKRGKMQYLYESESSGPRFAAMDLIPDDQKTKTLIQRITSALKV